MDVLAVNKKTAHDFVKKAQHLLHLPESLFDCDARKCNPKLYNTRQGKAATRRAKRCLRILKRVNKDLNQLQKILS